jgi:hypothetical protein
MSSVPFAANTMTPSDVARLIQSEVMGEDKVVEEKPIEAAIKKISGLLVIKIICLCVMMLAAVTSGYFIYSWSVASRGVLLSLAIATTMTSCQILLPELAIMLIMKKKAIPFLAAILVMGIALVATAFSMGATTGGIYDSRSHSLQSGTGDANASSIQIQLQSAREKKSTIQNQLLWAQKEAADYSNRISILLEAGESTFDLERKRDKARESITKLSTELDGINKEVANLTADNRSTVVIRDDFYSWSARILNMKPENVEFVMSAFPAIFNEIVAPTMLALIMFL